MRKKIITDLPEHQPITYTILRINPDGTRFVVACVEEAGEIGGAIDEDRSKIDFEAEYRVTQEAVS